jgi:hypothetical protein
VARSPRSWTPSGPTAPDATSSRSTTPTCWRRAPTPARPARAGEPYLTHPLAVAKILADLRMDVDTIATALLHDALEDNPITKEEMSAQVGPVITELVDGVTKIGKLKFRSKEELQAENFRKMMLAMSKDLRVILVKLADRLHNMRTLDGHTGREAARDRQGDDGHLRADRQPAGPHQASRASWRTSVSRTSTRRCTPRSRGSSTDTEADRGVHPRVVTALQDGARAAGCTGKVSGRAKAPVEHLRQDAGARGIARRTTSGPARVPADRARRGRLLPHARAGARAVRAGARADQGLHRAAQAQRVPVAPHHGDRPGEQAGRDPDPHGRHAPRSRSEGIAAHWKYKEGHLALLPRTWSR